MYLVIVLITGTIALSSPSFMIGAAQAEPYGMDDSYGYPDYRDDKDKKYDSYGPPVYGIDDSYGDKKSYDKRSYGNDYGYDKTQYQSHKPDYYKPKYTSYDGKDDSRDKSKDSVNINKLKCINNNLNINGNNTGAVNVGNKGAAEGHLGAYSSGYGSGYGNNKQ